MIQVLVGNENRNSVGNVACSEHAVDIGPNVLVDDDLVLIVELDSQLPG